MANYVEKSDASIVRERKTSIVEREAQRLFDEHGTLTPSLLVEAATDAESPLHRFFEWDNDVAAERYRLAQATQMIMATKFVVVLQEQRDIVPAVVHAQEHTAQLVRKFIPRFGRGEGFAPREVVLSDDEGRAALIDRKKGQLLAWCRSVVDIDELATVRDAIERALAG